MKCVVAFMVEILKTFEQVAVRFSPVVLVAPGLVMVVLGLLAWLAGTSLQRLVLGFFGAGVGALASFFAGAHNPLLFGVAAWIGAAFGAFLPRVFSAALLAVLGMAVTFVILARAPLRASPGTLFTGPEVGQTEEYTVPESLEVTRAYWTDAADRVRAGAYALAPTRWAILAAVGFGLLVLKLYLDRLAAAATCSALGTVLVFSGLVLLLIFKGSAPVAHIEQQGVSYGLVLVGMVLFGTVEQLVVCRRPGRAGKGEEGKTPAGQGGAKHAWRGG
jgi:hypothetical protein